MLADNKYALSNLKSEKCVSVAASWWKNNTGDMNLYHELKYFPHFTGFVKCSPEIHIISADGIKYSKKLYCPTRMDVHNHLSCISDYHDV